LGPVSKNRLLLTKTIPNVKGDPLLGNLDRATFANGKIIEDVVTGAVGQPRGARSVTEAQSRIQAAGYFSVSPLTQDANGWRGTALTGTGQPVNVLLDNQGRVWAQFP